MKVNVFFSGAPGAGYQAYPDNYSRLASVRDTPEKPDITSEYFEIVKANRVYYIYKRYDILTKKNGRPGSNFCIWLELENLKFKNWGRIQEEYFETLFQKGIIDAGKILEESADGKYYFTITNLSDKGAVLDGIASRAIEQFNSKFKSFSEELIFLEDNAQNSEKILRTYKKLQSKPEKLKTESNTSDGSLSHGLSHPNENTSNSNEEARIDALEKKANQLQLYVLIIAISILIILILSIANFFRSVEVVERPILSPGSMPSTNLNERPVNSDLYVNNQPDVTTIPPAAIRNNNELNTGKSLSLGTLKNSDVSPSIDCCIKKNGSRYFLSNLPSSFEEDSRFDVNVSKAEEVFDELANILWNELNLRSSEWYDNENQFYEFIWKKNPGDQRKLIDRIETSEITLREGFQELAEGSDFLLFSR